MVNLKYSLWSTVKLLNLFDVLSQSQSKISAKISAIIRFMQCNNETNLVKILIADEDQSTQHM